MPFQEVKTNPDIFFSSLIFDPYVWALEFSRCYVCRVEVLENVSKASAAALSNPYVKESMQKVD